MLFLSALFRLDPTDSFVGMLMFFDVILTWAALVLLSFFGVGSGLTAVFGGWVIGLAALIVDISLCAVSDFVARRWLGWKGGL